MKAENKKLKKIRGENELEIALLSESLKKPKIIVTTNALTDKELSNVYE